MGLLPVSEYISMPHLLMVLGLFKLLECRPGPIFGLKAEMTSKDGILLSWLPGSREVEEYRLTITSECNNWRIPECESSRSRRGVDEENFNTVEDGSIMRLLELSNDDKDLMGDKKMEDRDLSKDERDVMFSHPGCKVWTALISLQNYKTPIFQAVQNVTVLPPHTSYTLSAPPGQVFSISIAAKSSNPSYGPDSDLISASTLSDPPAQPDITEVRLFFFLLYSMCLLR